MSTMIAEVYDALLAAGAPEDKARLAAETLAGYESRFARIDRDLSLLKWMLATNIALTAAILLKLF